MAPRWMQQRQLRLSEQWLPERWRWSETSVGGMPAASAAIALSSRWAFLRSMKASGARESSEVSEELRLVLELDGSSPPSW